MTTTVSLAPLAVITGASTSISKELAREFAEHGYDLLIVADDADLSTTASELRSSTDAGSLILQTDLAEYGGVEELWHAMNADGRPVQALALSAGVGLGGDFVVPGALQHQ